ncbi:MAG: FAD-binding oxidoreductase [Candidatus Dormibacteraceae bacterium]
MSAPTESAPSSVAELGHIVGERYVITGQALEPFTHDATFLEGQVTAAVLPATTAEVSQVIAACSRLGIAVTARGSGTSLVGGSVSLSGGIILSLERLNEILIDAGNVCAVVGAGAITGTIQQAAALYGLMYPPDPASVQMSSIGGNVACNSGGPSCLKYGLTADYVMGMTVVLADGQVLRLGGRTRKRSSGHRLAQLFVGSEGTLGVVTEVILKLIPLPKHRATGMVGFRSAPDAAAAVARLMSTGYLPAALELMDRGALEIVGHLLPPGFESDFGCVLLIEHDGSSADQVQKELEQMVIILGGDDNRIAQSSAEREKLWNARRSFAKVLMATPKNFFAEDVSVPIASIPEMLDRVHHLAAETGLRIPVVGHAGDGNLHPSFVFEDGQRDLIGPAAARLFSDAVELGGSISGEHGLGAIKRDHAVREHSDLEFNLMRQLKRILDPSGHLNPHKVFPEGPPDGAFLERQPGWRESRRRSEIGD